MRLQQHVNFHVGSYHEKGGNLLEKRVSFYFHNIDTVIVLAYLRCAIIFPWLFHFKDSKILVKAANRKIPR